MEQEIYLLVLYHLMKKPILVPMLTELMKLHQANSIYAHVAGLTGGKFVAVWGDRSGNDGSAGGIFAQILNAKLEPVGEEFFSLILLRIFGKQSRRYRRLRQVIFLLLGNNQGALVGQFFPIQMGQNLVSNLALDQVLVIMLI